ncbi:hypothetical protein K438DRAFT_1995936 [Mycena galopus ATCC 62051]|nr:hypothetical protein K438DRAFT_1995936 [Mycena galopus ATCC 62051]
MSALLQEIIDTMLKLVPDRGTLLATALTSQHFSVPSQQRLFQCIWLHSPDVCKTLAMTLRRSPCLASFVKTLMIRLSLLPARFPPLGEILASTTSLQELDIDGQIELAAWIDQNQHTDILLHPYLVTLLHHNSVPCLGLSFLSHLLLPLIHTLLLHSPELSLMAVEVEHAHNYEYDTQDNGTSRLRSLNVSALLQLLDSLLTNWQLPIPLHLSIGSGPWDCALMEVPHAIELLRAHSGHLHTLDLRTDLRTDLAPDVKLPEFPLLSHLSLRIVLQTEDTDEPDMAEMLAKIPSWVITTFRSTPRCQLLSLGIEELDHNQLVPWDMLRLEESTQWVSWTQN